MAGDILLGTQGWNYPAWLGPFYPPHTRQQDLLKVYARAFRTVEVDSTFYATPPESTVRHWAERVPEGFVFALKLPQEITHLRELVDCRGLVTEFADRVRLLGSRLGPVLIQLGPDFGPEHRPAFERFVPILPEGIRWAVEFRRRGWLIKPVLELLGVHNVALALTDGRWVSRDRMLKLAGSPTADFAYVRWMGPDRSIEDYSRVQFDRGDDHKLWAETLTGMAARVRTVYGYFNNHYEGHSPASVRSLQRLVGQQPVEPAQLADQTELF